MVEIYGSEKVCLKFSGKNYILLKPVPVRLLFSSSTPTEKLALPRYIAYLQQGETNCNVALYLNTNIQNVVLKIHAR